MPANTPQFTFELKEFNHKLSVLQFTLHEQVSDIPILMAELVSREFIHCDGLIRQEALFTIKNPFADQGVSQPTPDRKFHGIVRSFRYKGEFGPFHLYETVVFPSLWLTVLKQDCRVFQDTPLVELVENLLQESGIPSDRYEFRIAEANPLIKFSIQYNETDYEYISRLLAAEGIFFFFEHYEDRHVLVFCDDNGLCKPINGNHRIKFNQGGGQVAEEQTLFAFDYSDRLKPTERHLTNFNFKTPSHDLMTHCEDPAKSANDSFDIYSYPGSYGDTSRGQHLAKIRMEGIVALKKKYQGKGNAIHCSAGGLFQLADHAQQPFNQKYFLFQVEHVGGQPGAIEEYAFKKVPQIYANEFVASPSTVPYRPLVPRNKPMVPGLLSAIVTGPEGEEIWPDEYGRVNVQFHFDREGQRNEKSSCWLRVVQFWNGATWGSQFIPRIGDEVLVSFVNGDMDYPIIIGSGTNAAMQPNYNLPANKTQSGIRTRSTPGGNPDNFNELRFEDKKDHEEVFLQAEKDWNIRVKNDKSQYVGHDEALDVRNNRTKTVGVDQTVNIGSNHTETTGANRNETVGRNKTELVKINSMETIGAAKELSIGGLYQISVGGAMNETVAGAKAEEVGLAKAVFVGKTMDENVVGSRTSKVGENFTETVNKKHYSKADEFVIEASKITLKSGSSTIVIDGNSITFKASKISGN